MISHFLCFVAGIIFPWTFAILFGLSKAIYRGIRNTCKIRLRHVPPHKSKWWIIPYYTIGAVLIIWDQIVAEWGGYEADFTPIEPEDWHKYDPTPRK